MKEWIPADQKYVRMSNYVCNFVGLSCEKSTLLLNNLCLVRKTKVETNGSIPFEMTHEAQKNGNFGLVGSQGRPQTTNLVYQNFYPQNHQGLEHTVIKCFACSKNGVPV